MYTFSSQDVKNIKQNILC